MPRGLTKTKSKLVFTKEKGANSYKIYNVGLVRTFLWDNPELRKAYREAREKENQKK